MSRVEEGIEIALWINGASDAATMIWVSESHAELLIDDGISLLKDQLVALVFRRFLSMPMRVEFQHGRHLLLRFVQRPHKSVLDLLCQSLLENGIVAAREAEEEQARPMAQCIDFEVWDEAPMPEQQLSIGRSDSQRAA